MELAVADWPAACRYYREVLGFREAHRDEAGRWSLFLPPGGGAGVALRERDGDGRVPEVALTFSCDDLAASARALEGRGARRLGELTVSPEGYRLVRFQDAEGRRINLYEADEEGRPGGPPSQGSGV